MFEVGDYVELDEGWNDWQGMIGKVIGKRYRDKELCIKVEVDNLKFLLEAPTYYFLPVKREPDWRV